MNDTLLSKVPDFKIDGSTSFNSSSSVCIPSAPGIYFIRDFRGVLYIGRTENLKRRFKEHFWNTNNPKISSIKKNPVGKIQFSWMLLDFSEQEIKEKELIQYFQPVCNRMLIKKGVV